MSTSNVILRERISVSQQFFQRRAEDSMLVDKSQSILSFLSIVRPIHLVLRPRRSGKSTTLTMFKVFFEKSDDKTTSKYLGFFQDLRLKIYDTPQFQCHFGQYIVLHFDFAGIGGIEFKEYESSFAYYLDSEIHRQRKLGNLVNVNQEDTSFLDGVLHLTGNKLANALRRVTQVLHECTGRMVLLLVDEYDTPLSSATNPEDCLKINNFLRHIFATTLKKNAALYGAFIVGILKQPTSGFLTGIPGLEIFTLSSKDTLYSDCFLYTEEEVRILYDHFKNLPNGLQYEFEELKRFYCGYQSGSRLLYNPWDINNALDRKQVGSYWTETGSSRFIVDHILAGTHKLRMAFVALLNGESVRLPMTWRPYLIYEDLRDSELFGLLYRSGYLTETQLKMFKIPNFEIHGVFASWAKYAVYKKIDSEEEFRQTVHPILETAVHGPSSKCRALLQDSFDRKCRPWICVRNFYQGFLIFGLFRHAADLRNGLSVTIHQVAEDGVLCFTLKEGDADIAIFYLFEAIDEKSLLKLATSHLGTSSGPAILADYIGAQARKCRVYRLFLWKDRITTEYAYWSRKANGVWRKSGKDL